MSRTWTWTVPLVFLLALAACGDRHGPAADAGQPRPAPDAPPAATPEAAVSLEDVVERDPRYLVGISYPPEAAAYPGLAAAMHAYAQAARAELMQALEALDGPPTMPYDLSLGFRILMQTPQVVAVAADGSVYTGGAHGQPLVARFVWLPQREEMLTARRLVPEAGAWEAIARQVAEQLGAAAQVRAGDAALEPGDRQRLLESALRMIDAGTEADPDNFAQFEPVAAPDGRIGAVRFVFAPYQVGPYADGVQYAEVPAATLLPYVAGEYRALFVQ